MSHQLQLDKRYLISYILEQQFKQAKKIFLKNQSSGQVREAVSILDVPNAVLDELEVLPFLAQLKSNEPLYITAKLTTSTSEPPPLPPRDISNDRFKPTTSVQPSATGVIESKSPSEMKKPHMFLTEHNAVEDPLSKDVPSRLTSELRNGICNFKVTKYLKTRSVSRLELDSEQARLAAYESLLYLGLALMQNIGQNRLLKLADESLRPCLLVSKKKHQALLESLRSIAGSRIMSPVMFRIEWLKVLNKQRASEGAPDFLVPRNRQWIFLYNVTCDEVNTVWSQLAQNKRDDLAGLCSKLRKSIEEGFALDEDSEVLELFTKLLASLSEVNGDADVFVSPFNASMINLTSQLFAAILELTSETFTVQKAVETINIITNLGAAKSPSSYTDTMYVVQCLNNWVADGFIPSQAKELTAYIGIKDAVVNITMFKCVTDHVMNASREEVTTEPALVDFAVRTIKQLQAQTLNSPNWTKGVESSLAGFYFWLETQLEHYPVEFSEHTPRQYLEGIMRVFLMLSPYFMAVSPEEYLPLKLPVAPESPLSLHVSRVLRKTREFQFVRSKNAQVKASTSSLNEANFQPNTSGIPLNTLYSVKQSFLNEFSAQSDFFMPAFSGIITKNVLWQCVMEPLIQQFRAEVVHLLEYPAIYMAPTHRGPKPTLDAVLIKLLTELHAINQAIFQAAMVLMGEDIVLSKGFKLSLLDLDLLVQPYLNEWMRCILADLKRIIFRCVEHDKEEALNDSFNISTSCTDALEYIFTIVEVFFSLPGSVHSSDHVVNNSFEAPKTDDYYSLLRGIHKTLRDNVQELCKSIIAAFEYYGELLTSSTFKVDVKDPRLYFSHRHKKQTEQKYAPSKEDKEFIFKVFRRINNLAFVKNKLLVIESTIKTKCIERGGVPEALLGYINHRPLFVSERDAVAWKDIFDKGQLVLNRALVRLLNYSARRLVFVNLREHIIDGLYVRNTGGDFSHNTLHSLSGHVHDAIVDIFQNVSADQALKAEDSRTSSIIIEDSLAHQLLLVFFKVFLDSYEAIVVMDAYLGRKFEAKDAEILLDDIFIIDKLFTDSGDSNDQMLPSEGVRGCLNPVRQIVSTLFPVDSQILVNTYDRLTKEEALKALNTPKKHTRRPTRVVRRVSSTLSVDEVVDELVREEAGELSAVIDEQEIANSSHDAEVSHVKKIISVRHDIHLLKRTKNPFGNDFLLGREAQSDLPAETFTPWRSDIVFNVIARRAGFGDPRYFNPDSSTLFSSKQQENGFDKVAFVFMKKHGMKRWLEKRFEKAEQLATKVMTGNNKK